MLLTIACMVASAVLSGFVTYRFGRVAHFEDLTMQYRDHLVNHLSKLYEVYQTYYNTDPGNVNAAAPTELIDMYLRRFTNSWRHVFRRKKIKQLHEIAQNIAALSNEAKSILRCNQNIPKLRTIANRLADEIKSLMDQLMLL